MAEHAKVSPSAAHRWLRCPGSVQANANKGYEQSAYALEGTTAHALLEVALRLHTPPEVFVGQTLEEGHMPITEEMADTVGYALDYVHAYLADAPKAKVRIEAPVFPAALLGVDQSVIWGTPDIQLDNHPHELVTIDYKHGVGIPVSVKENPQIKLYHAGARASNGRYRRYRSVVVQPRVPKRRPVQEHTITDKELVEWLDSTVRPTLAVALQPDAPRVAGDWCRYCAASGQCPEQLRAAFSRVQRDFKESPVGPKGLTPAELAHYLDQVPMVETALADLKAVAVRAVHAGVEIPGYEKAWTRTRRVWRDEEEANTLLEELGLEPRERYTVELLSPAKAEDALKAKGALPRRKRGEPAVPSPLDAVVAYTEPSPSIAKVPPV